MAPTAEPFEIIDAVQPWVSVEALKSWRATRSTRVGIVGRRSVGKTSLRNRMLAREDPVGLGGVTRTVDSVDAGKHTWIDTPGIDGRERALDVLGRTFDQADALVWVVDGLQPLTRTERQVFDLLWLEGTPVVVVVSKADLLGSDATAVRTRIERGTREYTPLAVVFADLRTEVPALPRFPRSPHQRAELASITGALREAFDRVEVPVCPADLARCIDVRASVRDWLSRWLSRSERMSVGEMLEDFGAGLASVRDEVLVGLAADPALGRHLQALPDLPTPVVAEGLGNTIRMTAAGREATLRELRAHAASWMGEAQIILSDWAETIPTDTAAAASWKRAHVALHGAP